MSVIPREPAHVFFPGDAFRFSVCPYNTNSSFLCSVRDLRAISPFGRQVVPSPSYRINVATLMAALS